MAASVQPVASHDVALSVRGLTVTLPRGMERTHAVENISFDLKRGQILCIIGESGSGKSSLLRILAGVDKDFNGEAVLSPGYKVGFLEQEPLIDDSRNTCDGFFLSMGISSSARFSQCSSRRSSPR